MDVLLKAFDSEIEARERCEPIGTSHTDSSTPKRPIPGQTNKDKDTTGATLTSQTERPALVSCTFCKQGHSSTNCSTVTDINSRKSLLKQQGRCFVCLRHNHLARNWSPNKVCRICSGRRHMSICESANRDSGAPRSNPQGSSVVAPDREGRKQIIYNCLCGFEHVNLATNSHCFSMDSSATAFCGEYARLIRQWKSEELHIRTCKRQTKFTCQEKREATHQDIRSRKQLTERDVVEVCTQVSR